MNVSLKLNLGALLSSQNDDEGQVYVTASARPSQGSVNSASPTSSPCPTQPISTFRKTNLSPRSKVLELKQQELFLASGAKADLSKWSNGQRHRHSTPQAIKREKTKCVEEHVTVVSEQRASDPQAQIHALQQLSHSNLAKEMVRTAFTSTSTSTSKQETRKLDVQLALQGRALGERERLQAAPAMAVPVLPISKSLELSSPRHSAESVIHDLKMENIRDRVSIEPVIDTSRNLPPALKPRASRMYASYGSSDGKDIAQLLPPDQEDGKGRKADNSYGFKMRGEQPIVGLMPQLLTLSLDAAPASGLPRSLSGRGSRRGPGELKGQKVGTAGAGVHSPRKSWQKVVRFEQLATNSKEALGGALPICTIPSEAEPYAEFLRQGNQLAVEATARAVQEEIDRVLVESQMSHAVIERTEVQCELDCQESTPAVEQAVSEPEQKAPAAKTLADKNVLGCESDPVIRFGTNPGLPDYRRAVAVVAAVAQSVAASALLCVDLGSAADSMPGSVVLSSMLQDQVPDWERSELRLEPMVHFVGHRLAKAAERLSGYMQDMSGNYLVASGDHLAWRYEVQGLLGQGAFAAVYRCIDHATEGAPSVAVKVSRARPEPRVAALREAEIMLLLQADTVVSVGRARCLPLLEFFNFRGHACLVLPRCHCSLYEMLKVEGFRGRSAGWVRRCAVQLLQALLHLGLYGVVHGDIKPENILLVPSAQPHTLGESESLSEDEPCTFPPDGSSSRPSTATGDLRQMDVMLADFGTAFFTGQDTSEYMQSRYYRAPEVLLRLDSKPSVGTVEYSTRTVNVAGYGPGIDMWSLAALLPELRTGAVVFPGENETDQVGCIAELLGQPPIAVSQRSKRRGIFASDGQLLTSISRAGQVRLPGNRRLHDVCRAAKEGDPFVDFVAMCLRWDANERPRPEEALRHRWFDRKSGAARTRLHRV